MVKYTKGQNDGPKYELYGFQINTYVCLFKHGNIILLI